MLYVILVLLFKLPVMLIMRPKIIGDRKALATKGGTIFIANHRELMDPVMMAVVCPRIIHFMAKKELFNTGIGRWFFNSLNVFPVNRKSADLTSLKKALKLLEEGKSFGIFPEGRRAITDRLDEFEKGAAFIAAKSNAPIIPLYISTDSYRKCRLRIAVGSPIYPSVVAEHCEKRQLNDVLTNRMQSALESLRIELEGRG